MLVYVPIASPNTAKITNNIFLNTIHLNLKPFLVYQYVDMSIIAGIASPKADRHSAPNNDINNPNFGMATARRTGIKICFN